VLEKFICKILGHDLITTGYILKQWTTTGYYLMNKIKKPIKLKTYKCKRCNEEFIQDEKDLK
jgi:hypothetical protein